MVITELYGQLQQLTDGNYPAIERYLYAPLPNEMDHDISHLCALYRQADEGSRCVASQSLDVGRAAWLNVFAYRMALLAVRQQSTELLNDALLALLIIAHRDDRHNFFMTLSIVHHSASKLGNPDLLFLDAVRYACDAESAGLLLGFLDRSPQDKRIEIMGFQEIKGQNGVIYVSANQEIPVTWK